jgi:hypothetical protein
MSEKLSGSELTGGDAERSACLLQLGRQLAAWAACARCSGSLAAKLPFTVTVGDTHSSSALLDRLTIQYPR